MKTIIVENEKRGREILEKLIRNYCPDIEISGSVANADEAYNMILEDTPDLVFLDVEMPNGDGFSLLERFEEIPFRVIFTTAYDHYAIKAIKYEALDYLLKPINVTELKEAIIKAQKKQPDNILHNKYKELLAANRLSLIGRIGLPIKDGLIYIAINDIIRVESEGSYSIFYTEDGHNYIVAKYLKEYEVILPGIFFRIHKSHLINIKKVKKYLRTDGYFVEMVDGSIVEVSRRKKDEFLEIMNGNKLS